MNAAVSQIGAQISCTGSSIPPQSSAGSTINGAGIDARGYRSCVIRGEVGAVSGSPTSFTVDLKIQDSADNSTFADYSPPLGKGKSIATLTAANSAGALAVDLEGARQYVRLVQTVAFVGGTSPSALVCGQIIFGGAVVKPTTL